MTTFLRRIVSGPKTRHVDKELGVDLDLVYVTDRLIIMGWPASNLAALYRNKRKSVRRFLDAKHGEQYRVYNLCPASENWYDPQEFHGSVSRYPFPDHHPPPLSMIPMFVCDVTAWLAQDPENVVVIHCKAGKGRSGTMACSYLLSLPILPPPATDGEASVHESRVNQADEAVRPPAASRNASTVIEKSRQMLDGLDPVMLGNLLAEHPAMRDEQDKQPAVSNDDDDTGQNQDAQRAGAVAAAVGDFHTAYTAEALAERMYAVFEMHTSRRLKPAKMSTTARSSGVNSASDSSPSDSQAALPFLQQDPGARGRSASPKDKRLGRSKSVADLWRNTSGGFRRSSVPETPPSALAMSRADANSDSGGARESARSSSSRPRSPLRSPRRDLHALGVKPMGRSTADLSLGAQTSTTPERRPSFRTLVQGWASTPNVGGLGTTSAKYTGNSCLSPTSNDDGNVSPTAYHLAPPLFRPGQSVTLNSSDQSVRYTRMASTSQLSLGAGGKDRFSAAATYIDDLMADAEEEDVEEHVPRLAVSIPSQRRFVGYWARILSGQDPREPLSCPTGQAPRRMIRITRILVDRRVKANGSGGAISVQLGRYDNDLEERLHAWELSARRRTRAYRFADPSAATPDLPKSELSEHGTDFRGPLRRRQEREAEEKQWKYVAEQNELTGYHRRVAQHGNEHGVGCWGINVLAEEERVRTFTWTAAGSRGQDDEHHGLTAAEMQAQKKAAMRETEIETLAMLKESDRKMVRPQAQSRLDVSSTDQQHDIVRHKFSLEGDANVKLGGPGLPTWLGSGWPHSGSQRASSRASQENTGNNTDRSNETSSSGSSLHANPQSGQGHEETPHTSVENALDARAQGVIVDADHALQIKLLSGRSGAGHARLSDMAACGYIWFIPSFETPSGSCVPGERIRRSFTAAEIDFRKAKSAAKLVGGEVRRVTVEWEWIETGSAGWNDESDDE